MERLIQLSTKIDGNPTNSWINISTSVAAWWCTKLSRRQEKAKQGSVGLAVSKFAFYQSIISWHTIIKLYSAAWNGQRTNESPMDSLGHINLVSVNWNQWLLKSNPHKSSIWVLSYRDICLHFYFPRCVLNGAPTVLPSQRMRGGGGIKVHLRAVMPGNGPRSRHSLSDQLIWKR